MTGDSVIRDADIQKFCDCSEDNVLACLLGTKVIGLTWALRRRHQLQSVWGNEDYQNCGVASQQEKIETVQCSSVSQRNK